jgi:hypothetical protein
MIPVACHGFFSARLLRLSEGQAPLGHPGVKVAHRHPAHALGRSDLGTGLLRDLLQRVQVGVDQVRVGEAAPQVTL